jgi:hypothetical protein
VGALAPLDMRERFAPSEVRAFSSIWSFPPWRFESTIPMHRGGPPAVSEALLRAVRLQPARDRQRALSGMRHGGEGLMHPTNPQHCDHLALGRRLNRGGDRNVDAADKGTVGSEGPRP